MDRGLPPYPASVCAARQQPRPGVVFVRLRARPGISKAWLHFSSGISKAWLHFSAGMGQGPLQTTVLISCLSLVVEVASNKMAVTHVLCFRRHFLTDFHALTAAGMELTARRRICR